jgi:hypothetical protein
MNTREPQLIGGERHGALSRFFGSAATRLLAGLLAAAPIEKTDVWAQTADSQISTNEVQQSEETGADGVQAADPLAPEDMTSTNSIAENEHARRSGARWAHPASAPSPPARFHRF